MSWLCDADPPLGWAGVRDVKSELSHGTCPAGLSCDGEFGYLVG